MRKRIIKEKYPPPKKIPSKKFWSGRMVKFCVPPGKQMVSPFRDGLLCEVVSSHANLVGVRPEGRKGVYLVHSSFLKSAMVGKKSKTKRMKSKRKLKRKVRRAVK